MTPYMRKEMLLNMYNWIGMEHDPLWSTSTSRYAADVIGWDNGHKITLRQLHLAVDIKKVIFNDPATIILWDDGTKTVVKANNEPFDKEKGLAMAIAKKTLGNKGNYFEIFKKYCTRGEQE